MPLAAKEGISLINNNSFGTGLAALALADALRLLDACTVGAALDWEAFAANTSPLHPAVAAARPYPGIVRRSVLMRELLDGSYLWEPGAARNLQDPLTFRNAAGILGAVDDGLGFACRQLADRAQRRAREPARRRRRRRSSSRCRTTRRFRSRQRSISRASRSCRRSRARRSARSSCCRPRSPASGRASRRPRPRATSARCPSSRGPASRSWSRPARWRTRSPPRRPRRCSPRASRTASRWRRWPRGG